MDGRRFRRWWLLGGVVVAVGCKTTAHPTGAPAQVPAPGAAVGAVPAAGGTVPGMVAEPVVTRSKKTGPMPDFETEMAALHVNAALAEPPPPNRDELLDMARSRYGRALKADPKHKGALVGQARMYARLGDRAKAAEAYEKYRKAHPKDPDAAHEMAVVHARWGDWAGAVGWCEAALRIDPENRAVRRTQGFCLARGGRAEEAVAVLCKIMPEAQARYNVAHALDDMNALDASRQQLELAVRADPNFGPAREALAEVTGPAADPNPVRPVGHQEPPR